jgi:hypothetical protein
MRYFIPTAILAGLLLTSGCGGGGGGGEDFIGAATVSLSASPRTIDTGDRTEIRCDVRNVADTGIILKFRFPVGLEYVPESASITEDGVRTLISPQFLELDEDEDFFFLVFFLRVRDFARDGSGRVEFQLAGKEETDVSIIEVDADIDDPLIDNASEFDREDPQFAPESAASITVTP